MKDTQEVRRPSLSEDRLLEQNAWRELSAVIVRTNDWFVEGQ